MVRVVCASRSSAVAARRWVVLREGRDLRAVEQRHIGQRGRVLQQDRLQVQLVDAVRRLGRRPPGVGAFGLGVTVTPAGIGMRVSSMPVTLVRNTTSLG
jgi:hypothetical protein